MAQELEALVLPQPSLERLFPGGVILGLRRRRWNGLEGRSIFWIAAKRARWNPERPSPDPVDRERAGGDPSRVQNVARGVDAEPGVGKPDAGRTEDHRGVEHRCRPRRGTWNEELLNPWRQHRRLIRLPLRGR